MYPVLLLRRLFLISLIFGVPFSLLGLIMFGKWGALALGIGTLLSLFCLACFSESGIARVHRAALHVPPGLDHSLAFSAQAAFSEEDILPRIMVFPEPRPKAFAVRAIGSRGTILLSQGLIAVLNEAELRTLLTACIIKIRKRGSVFQSFCCFLALSILSLAPRVWNSLLLRGKSLSPSEERKLSPLSALVFLVFYPFARFLLACGRLPGEQKGPVHLEIPMERILV